MKPTLNEEIGMSQQGIDYVNSLEVKEEVYIPETPMRDTNFILNEYAYIKAIKNNIPEEIKKERIRKQARNNLIFVAIVLIIVLIVNWKS